MIRQILLTLFSLSLIGCGGGGGGGSSSGPKASFSVSSTSGQIPFTVTLDASSSSGASSYSWTFGDGTSATGVNPSKTYTEPGVYTIILTVTNDGKTNKTNQQVTALGYNISGTITAPQTSVADSDTADPNMNVSNNSFAIAQLLPTPAIVGGFVNEFSTDSTDFYRIELSANQTINLTTYRYQNNVDTNPDLDLYLYDENQNAVDSAVSQDASESLTVAQDGIYYLEVRAYSNSANYLLNIGGSTINHVSQTLSSEFVVGEALFRNKQNAITASGTSVPDIGKLTMSDTATATSSSISSKAITTSKARTASSSAVGHWTEEQLDKLQTLLWIKQLNKADSYQYVEPNFYRKASLTPNDQYFNFQWHYDNIQLEDALDLETGNNSVIVAVADTGVLLNHPDLQGQFVAGYDFISSTESSQDDDGIDNDPNDPGDDSNFDGSSSFHGTHVAGTVAAATNNAVGISGVAGGVRIMPLRVLGKNGVGTSSDIIQSLRFAAGLSNSSGTTPAQTADVINLSLGSTSSSQAEQDLYNTLATMDILVVAAAGNSNSSTPDYPAAYNNVISVSATNISNQRAYYSNFGSTIDVAAPGGELTSDLNGDGFPDGVLSTLGDDSGNTLQYIYGYSEGTSMAAPHVAGVAALMKSANSNLTVAQFNTLLQNGDLTDDLGAAGRDNSFGYGLINARKAVLAATGAVNASANIVLSSNSLNFGSFSDTTSITAADSSDGTLAIASVTPSESWLSITSDTIDANGFGTYQVSVDRTLLADGLYTASIVFDATSTTETLNVLMQVTTTAHTADAGYIYILAIDPEERETQGFTAASSVNGLYTYTIENLTSGEYQVVAGTDLNADSLICDQGDSCGAFPTLDQTSILTINGDADNIDFTVSFENSISASSSSNETQQSTELFQVPSSQEQAGSNSPSLAQ
ncbi:S8 family serine peptidase [Litoribrevibacter euphylliae]|uniref:S8 family serine peptidase n=1 Tax=Litoribrevibacter euphylliae TaxID=1834034 RepID=A0ABV7HLH1_9GAMM